jgi:glycine cleavage system transcriptional repressor
MNEPAHNRKDDLMRTNIVFTLTGTDRIGLVDDITELLLQLGGNVETSRMVRLGGEFAVLMLVSLPAEHLSRLDQAVAGLTAEGYKITVTQTEPALAATAPPSPPTWRPYRIEVEGADHEGIIHEIAHHLSQRGINIESMDTGTRPAPVSGTPLFTMTARVAVPAGLEGGDDWEGALNEVGQQMNVEITVSADADA